VTPAERHMSIISFRNNDRTKRMTSRQGLKWRLFVSAWTIVLVSFGRVQCAGAGQTLQESL